MTDDIRFDEYDRLEDEALDREDGRAVACIIPCAICVKSR